MTDNDKSDNSIIFDVPLIQEWLEEAGSIALGYFQKCGHIYKIDQTPVTEADKAVEQFLVDKIQRTFPKHGIIAEEQTTISGDEYTWVIDPIDGTTAFIMGVPTWCIAIGILKQNEPYFGIVYLPVTKELYYAYSNGEAFWNNQTIHLREDLSINNRSILCISTYSFQSQYFFFPGRVFSFGSGIYQHLLVARGAAIASITLRPKIWDLAAVFPILNAIGGSIQYLSGNKVYCNDLLSGQINEQPILVGDVHIISKLTEMIIEHETYS